MKIKSEGNEGDERGVAEWIRRDERVTTHPRPTPPSTSLHLPASPPLPFIVSTSPHPFSFTYLHFHLSFICIRAPSPLLF